MKTEYEFIRFVAWPVDPKRKTQKWDCRSIRSDTILGFIEWQSGWRRYIFASADDVIFSAGCLADIQDFIEQAMKERR